MDAKSVTETLAAVKGAFDLFREAIRLAKEGKELLPSGDKRDSVEVSLAAAERATRLAEAQIAHALGYCLCQCTFPPQIMLSIGTQNDYEHFRCPQCQKVAPQSSPAPSPSERGSSWESLY